MIRPRVLVVDDEAEAAALVVRALVRLGWDAQAASGGTEALARFDQAWDAVVTDLRMPGIDGLQVLAALRLRLPAARRVVITAFGDKAAVLGALNAGAHHLLEKPFTVDQLDTVLRRLLDERDGAHSADPASRLATLPLSPRERELVALVLKGLANRDIAHQLGIGEQTVKNALSAAYQRLGVGSRAELFHLLM